MSGNKFLSYQDAQNFFDNQSKKILILEIEHPKHSGKFKEVIFYKPETTLKEQREFEKSCSDDIVTNTSFIKKINQTNSNNEELKKILLRPNLFNEITEEEFDKKIVGEIESRKVIFLCSAGGRLVENCQVASFNILVNDEAGTGKDYVTGRVLEILPKEVYLHKTRISPTVFTYWHNAQYEPEWTWDGKVFYPEDISEIVLNSDVFKVMCSSGSSATITIKQKAVDIEIIGKPVMITTTATATPNPELTRRFVILNLDGSEEQTKAIMKRHCEYAKNGIVPSYNLEYTKALALLGRVKVKIPFAEYLSEILPSKSIIMRTHLPRFLDYIKASAGIYQFQRNKEGEFILAEGQDYDIARECFIKLCSNKYMIPLTLNQKKILDIFSKNPNRTYSVTQFHGESNFMSVPSLQTNFSLLAKYGILQTSMNKDSYGRDLEVYGIAKSYNSNEAFEIPKYADLLKHLKQLNYLKQVKHLKQVGDVKDIKDVKVVKCLNNSEIPSLNNQIDTFGLKSLEKINFSDLDKEFPNG